MYSGLSDSYYLLLSVAGLVIYYLRNWLIKRNYPPGPIGLPLLGYWPFLKKKTHLQLTELRKIYGDVYSICIGPQLNIIVTDYELMKEILNHPLVLARPPHLCEHVVGNGGFTGKYGAEWKEERRFAVQTMKLLGLGKGIWEKIIQTDAIEFIRELQKSGGQPMGFKNMLSMYVEISLLSLLFGRQLDPETDFESLQAIKKFGYVAAANLNSVDLVFNLPWLITLVEFFNVSKLIPFILDLRRCERVFIEEVNRRVDNETESAMDDFIGYYLQEMERRKNNKDIHPFTIESLQGNLMSLILAGYHSTVVSVSWLLLLMAQHQDIQDKVFKEIDRTVGRSGLVFYEDRTKLPYTSATIMEVLRWVTTSPLFSSRYVTDTFTFKGFTIPKGSHIVGNSWGMMHDPKYFPDPMDFKPERFLSDDGSKVVTLDGYGPFSFGKRGCPGDNVAMMSIFIYFVNIVQTFCIKAPEGKTINLQYDFSVSVSPKPQKLRFINR